MRTLALAYLATLTVVLVLLAGGEPEDSSRGALLAFLLVALGAILAVAVVIP